MCVCVCVLAGLHTLLLDSVDLSAVDIKFDLFRLDVRLTASAPLISGVSLGGARSRNSDVFIKIKSIYSLGN